MIEERRSYPVRLAGLGVVVAIGTYGMLAFVLSTPAIAGGCGGAEFRAVQLVPGTNGRGVRVAGPGMEVFNSAVDCLRVSSIADVNSSGTRWEDWLGGRPNGIQ